ncbi:MAG: hypothetical protein WAM71_02925 [Candidatus Korobacteraceae bacterium]
MTALQIQYVEKDACYDPLPSFSSPLRADAWGKCEHETRVRRKPCLKPTKFDTFKQLVEQWQSETWFKSSLSKRISHPAYLKIIGLGKEALPWILRELRDEPDHWFPALEAITREDHAPNAKNPQELRTAWLAWGEKNIGY